MSATNGLTKSVWAEYVEHSGEEVFAITHAIYNPSYVEWLESELRAAWQKIKEAEQTIHQQVNYAFCGSCDTGYSNWKCMSWPGRCLK